MTFVRTRILLDRLGPGRTAEIRLQGAEPLANVPRSARDLGHTLVSLEPEPGQPPDGIHRLFIRTAEPAG